MPEDLKEEETADARPSSGQSDQPGERSVFGFFFIERWSKRTPLRGCYFALMPFRDGGTPGGDIYAEAALLL